MTTTLGKRLTTTDASTYVQGRIDAAITNGRGGTCSIKASDLLCKKPIVVKATSGLIVRGMGEFRSNLVADFPEEHQNRSLLEFGNTERVVTEHLRLEANAPCEALMKLARLSGKPGLPTLTGHHHRNLSLDGKGKAKLGIRIGGSDKDENNEHHDFEKIDIRYTTEAAIRQEGLQAKAITYRSINWYGGRVAKYGIDCQGGSFRAYDCKGGYMAEADYFLGRPADNVVIQGFDHEGSARLIASAGPSATPWPVTVLGGRWHSELLPETRVDRGERVPDGRVIVFLHAGPLVVDSVTFRADGVRPVRILHAAYGPYRTQITNLDLCVDTDRQGPLLEVHSYYTGDICVEGIQCRDRADNARQRPDLSQHLYTLGSTNADKPIIGQYREKGDNPVKLPGT